MNTIRLPIDTIYGRREVEFTGRKLGKPFVSKLDDNGQGTIKTEYEIQGQRRIIYISRWTGQPDNTQSYIMIEIGEPDFLPPSDLPRPEQERPLELDEALALSLPPT